MRIHQIQNNRSSVIELTAIHGAMDSSGNTPIVTILNNSTSLWRSRHPEVVGALTVLNAFIHEIRITAFISGESLPEAILNISEAMDKYEANRAALTSLWQDMRFHFSVLYKSGDLDSPSTNWAQLGYESIQNKSYYPYSLHDLFEFFTRNLTVPLGENDQVAVQIVPVNHNGEILTLKGSDKITLRLNWKQEAFLVEPDLQPIGVVVNSGQVTNIAQTNEITIDVIGIIKRQVLAAQTTRIGGQIENQGSAAISYFWGDTSKSTADGSLATGASVQFPSPYTGPVTLQSSSGSQKFKITQIYTT